MSGFFAATRQSDRVAPIDTFPRSLRNGTFDPMTTLRLKSGRIDHFGSRFRLTRKPGYAVRAKISRRRRRDSLHGNPVIRKSGANVGRIELVIGKDGDTLTGFGLGGTSTARRGCRSSTLAQPIGGGRVHSVVIELTVHKR